MKYLISKIEEYRLELLLIALYLFLGIVILELT